MCVVRAIERDRLCVCVFVDRALLTCCVFLFLRILWRGLTRVSSVPVLVPRGMPCDKGGREEAFQIHLELASSSPKKVMSLLQHQRRLGWRALQCLLIEQVEEEEGQRLPLQQPLHTSAQKEQRGGAGVVDRVEVGVVHSLVDRVPDVHCLPSAAPLPQARRMLTYAHVCSRMLTYAHVCSCRAT